MNVDSYLIPTFLCSVIVVAGIFALIPVQEANTVHQSLATPTNLSNKDHVVELIFYNVDVADEFITSAVENGWVGRVTLFLCDESADPSEISIDVDTNNDGDTDDAGENNVVSFDLGGPGCNSVEGALPDGTDRIALEYPDARPNTVIVTLHLDTIPEI